MGVIPVCIMTRDGTSTAMLSGRVNKTRNTRHRLLNRRSSLGGDKSLYCAPAFSCAQHTRPRDTTAQRTPAVYLTFPVSSPPVSRAAATITPKLPVAAEDFTRGAHVVACYQPGAQKAAVLEELGSGGRKIRTPSLFKLHDRITRHHLRESRDHWVTPRVCL